MKNEKNESTKVLGKLYVVATPIGNISDFTTRAVEILQNVDIVAAEDTRKFLNLMRRAKISLSGRLLAHYSYNEKNSSKGLLNLLQDGKSVALVSDAGTPRISDPGLSLVSLCYEKNIIVIPIPGPSALTSLLMVCPLVGNSIIFLGYLPINANKKRNLLSKYTESKALIVFYESVHRVNKTLSILAEIWPESQIFCGREMTKVNEEYVLGSIEELLFWSKGKRGEFAFAVSHKIKKTLV